MTTRAPVQGASRLGQLFGDLRAQRRKGIMPFIVGGYPTINATREVLPALARAGATVIEVGIPFSDPIADGPVIAGAMHEAIELGITPMHVLEAISDVRSETSCGIVAMVSISIVHRLARERFIAAARDAGVDGFIFPDVPLEEAGNLGAIATSLGLTSSLLVAPTTPDERAQRIAAASSGFIYMLARGGITGTDRGGPAQHLAQRIARLRSTTDLPIACGFGISAPDHVRAIVHGAGADAAIVGTAVVTTMSKAQHNGNDPASAASNFITTLRSGLN